MSLWLVEEWARPTVILLKWLMRGFSMVVVEPQRSQLIVEDIDSPRYADYLDLVCYFIPQYQLKIPLWCIWIERITSMMA